LYGDAGATACLDKSSLTGGRDRKLLRDIVSTERRRLSWFAVHFPVFTKWLYSQTGIVKLFAARLYPMKPPTTYTGIREHAWNAWTSFQTQAETKSRSSGAAGSDASIVELLHQHQVNASGGRGKLTDLDIASECADHLLAGIDTTSDSLMFLIWALSRPANLKFQNKLIQEIDSLKSEDFDASDSIPKPEIVTDTGRMPYLDLVIKETLRLYAPLPASEPRSFPEIVEVDGYQIPAGTVISLLPYALHRKEDVFEDPLVFNPERWETRPVPEDTDAADWAKAEEERLSEMRKWYWAFSSGPRMCIGIQ
jgi:cytochrome P450